MESFFFNLGQQKYKQTTLFSLKNSYINRIDISNGLVFFEAAIKEPISYEITIKNLDRMILLSLIQEGEISIKDNIDVKQHQFNTQSMDIYASSQQNFTLTFNCKGNYFILFIADFFLKRYLSSCEQEPINYLYNLTQHNCSLKFVEHKKSDALSLHMINKIIQAKNYTKMKSIICEQSALEWMIHRFNLLETSFKENNSEEEKLASKAKAYLLENYITPPSIQELAHLCATNESKLKHCFKQTYQTTIYTYIQKLRLEQANLLLKERLLNIGEIAQAVGYKHQGHFSKIFYQTYGIYPKDLLKH